MEVALWIAGAFLAFVMAVAIIIGLVFFVSAMLFLRQVQKQILEPVVRIAGIGIGRALGWVERKQIKER